MSIFSRWDEKLSRVESLADRVPEGFRSNSRGLSMLVYACLGIWPLTFLGSALGAVLSVAAWFQCLGIACALTLGFYLTTHGISAKYGISSGQFLRLVFGHKLFPIFSVLCVFISCIWLFWGIWFGAGVSFFAIASFFSASPALPHVAFFISVIVCIFISLWLSHRGWVGPVWLARMIAPVMIALLIVVLVAVVNSQGGWSNIINVLAPKHITPVMPFMLGLGSFAAIWINFSIIGGAMARNLTPRAFLPGPFLGMAIAMFVIMLPGGVIMWSLGTFDLVGSALQISAVLGVFTGIFLWLTVWTSNVPAIYSYIAEVANIARRPRTIITFIAIGISGIAIVTAFYYSAAIMLWMVNWLSIVGFSMASISAVIVADHYVLRKRRYPYFADSKLNYNWVALGVVIGCSILGWFLSTRFPFLGTVVLQWFITFGLYLAIATPLRGKLKM